MKSENLVSVIIPVFNRSRLVLRAIDSVLNQSWKNIEIILIDDGSTDDLAEKLEIYGTRLKVIFQTNQGVSNARNRGIESANGCWITFLDSDDEWKKNKILRQMQFHDSNPEILFSQTEDEWIRNSVFVNQPANYKKPHGKVFGQILAVCNISASGVMLHQKVIQDIGMFDETMKVCEDYDLWLRIARKYSVGLVEEALVIKYGGHADQLSRKYSLMDEQRIFSLEKHLDYREYLPQIKSEIIKKCEIILQGARKRNNFSVIKKYTEKLELFNQF